MHTSPLIKVQEVLRSFNAAGEVREFTSSVPTALAAAAALGCEVGAIANSLIFAADSEPLLIIASGGHRVDLKKVSAHLGFKKISRADQDFVFQATGQKVGGVAPFGHPSPIMTVIDEVLCEFEIIWAGAGTEHAMFSTTADELLRITGGKLIAVV